MSPAPIECSETSAADSTALEGRLRARQHRAESRAKRRRKSALLLLLRVKLVDAGVGAVRAQQDRVGHRRVPATMTSAARRMYALVQALALDLLANVRRLGQVVPLLKGDLCQRPLPRGDATQQRRGRAFRSENICWILGRSLRNLSSSSRSRCSRYCLRRSSWRSSMAS